MCSQEKLTKVIAFIFHIANTQGLLVRIVGHLVVVAASGSHQAQLVIRRLVKGQGRETAEPRPQIVQDLRARRFQSEIGAVTGNAAIVSEAVGVVAETELVFGAVKAAIAGDQFGLAIALKPGTGDDVEDAVSAVAVFRRVAAALHFQVVDVLGIELGTDVGRNIRIGHGNAVNQPRDLVSTAYMELVVDHVRARNIIGDHVQAVGLIGARSLRDLAPRHQGGGRRRLSIDLRGCVLDFDRLFRLRHGQRKVRSGLTA